MLDLPSPSHDLSRSRKTKTIRKATLRSRLFLGASSLLIAFMLAEVILRALGIAYPRLRQPDFERGASFIPGTEWHQTREGDSYVIINGEGFNDRQHALKKPLHCFRIAVLGDSYVAALQVDRQRRFTEIIEKTLNQRKCLASENVEVMNFGVSDYGTLQELIVLRQQVWQYDPDMIILAVFPENDLDDNCRQLAYHLRRPFAVIRDGRLDFDNSFRSSYPPWWKRHVIDPCIDYSRVLHVVRRAHYLIREDKNEEFSSLMDLAKSPRFSNIYHESDDEARRESWEITDALLSLMHQEVTDHGARFGVVVLGSHLQVTPDISVRTKLLEIIGADTLFYPGDRIKAIGQREGFSVLDLAPAFQLYADQHNVYLHAWIKDNDRLTPFGHWTERGHQLAAQLIADELCRHWLPDTVDAPKPPEG